VVKFKKYFWSKLKIKVQVTFKEAKILVLQAFVSKHLKCLNYLLI